MKLTISNLNSCEIKRDRAVFSGQGGSLTLALYEPGVLSVTYDFDRFPITEKLQNASAFMTQEKPFAPWTADMTDEGAQFVFNMGDGLEISVLKETGVVTVKKNGKLLHGGAIGDADLVVPSYPVRVIYDGAHGYGHFNFPRKPGDEFYGLGDKGGYPDHSGKRFLMFNRDSLGYEPEENDPLYKSIPFVLKVNPEQGVFLGVYFPQACIKAVDLGRESPHFYYVETDGGPFTYCLMTGDNYHEVAGRYARLCGLSALPPLYSFGFLGSSMNYVEPDDAPQRVLDYFARTEQENIPCEGMYVSSGYLKAADGKRYALLWNQQKFPNYGAYLRALSERGYHLIMNIKPGVLVTHPWYESIRQKGYFIKDENGEAYVEYFWGGGASFVDFNNPEAKAWWQSELKKQYLDHGCEGIWNDNNELELEDTELDAYQLRSLYPVRMAQASYEICKEFAPDKRPWIYSRSGGAGLQRYARTWSGDNTSTYKALRFNQYMGLSMGISGLPIYGHDLGGFFGDFPEEELLIRSCESGVFQSRMVIHSWREDGVPTEPWSYPTATDRIRKLIQAHYRVMPYLYDCAIHACTTGVPIERVLHLEFPQDKNLCSRDANMLFGDFVLKVQPVDKGVTTVTVRLPEGEGWFDPRSGKLYAGGQTIEKAVPMDGDPHFMLRQGAIFPTTEKVSKLSTALFDDTTVFLLPCQPGCEIAWDHYEDDGVSEWSLGKVNQFEIKLTDSSVTVTRVAHGAKAEAQRMHTLRLPKGFAFKETGSQSIAFDPDGAQLDQPMTFEFTGAY